MKFLNISAEKLGIAAVVAVGSLIYVYQTGSQKRGLATRAAVKVKQRNAKKHEVLIDALTEEEESLCGLTSEKLRELLASKQKTCEAVIQAFCRKARRDCFVDGLNAITEEFYDEAMEQARNIDLHTTPEMWEDVVKYPLLGLPISVKDNIIVKGTDCTYGLQTHVFRDGPNGAVKDGTVVEVIKKAGGIPFLKSNVPQFVMLPETDNNLWGRTNNFHNSSRTAGGSSGGEGALVASNSSVIGLGTDIMGNVRIPALFNGIFGFKPTDRRIIDEGYYSSSGKNNYSTNPLFKSVVGPLAKNVEGCATMMRALFSETAHDLGRNVPLMPFNEKIYCTGSSSSSGKKKKLRIGYFLTNNHIEPCKTAIRASMEAREAFASRGHKVKEFFLNEQTGGDILQEIMLTVFEDLATLKQYEKDLDGEGFHSLYFNYFLRLYCPGFIHQSVKGFFALTGQHRLKKMMDCLPSNGTSVTDLYSLQGTVHAFRDAWFEATKDFDIILCPGIFPAHNHGCRDMIMTATYNCIANILRWPCGAVPVTQVLKEEENYPLDPLPLKQQDSFAKTLAKHLEGSEGMPVGVQVLAKPFNDELCLYAMMELEVALKERRSQEYTVLQ